MPRSASRHHLPRWSPIGAAGRAMALMLATVLVLAGILDSHHQATTRHVQCAEHGMVVHVAGAAPSALTGDRVDDAPSPAPIERLRDQPATDPGREHEHCSFPPTAVTRVDAPPAIRAIAALPAAVTPAPAVDVALADGRGLHRSAPKTSPPA